MQINKTRLYITVFFICFWIWATFGFISEEIMPFLAPLRSVIFLLLDVVILTLSFLTLQDKWSKVFVFLYICYALFTTCVLAKLGVLNFVNGSRDYISLLMFPIILSFFKSEYSNEFKKRFDKTLYIFLIIQFCCIFFQFLKYGANDHGGGSMGNGYSGIASILICIISFYLIQKKWDYNNYFVSLISNKSLIILLLPIFFNETKVSFILVLLYIILLVKFDKNVISKFIIGFPVLLGLFMVLLNVYMSATGNDDDITSMEYYTESYIDTSDPDELILIIEALEDGVFEEGETFVDIPRFTKLAFFPDLMESSGNNVLFGAGLSHIKGGTLVEETKFAKEYKWYLRGTQIFSFYTLVQLGYIGLIGCILYFCYCFGIGKKIPNRLINLQIFLFVATVIIFFYNDSFRFALFGMVFFYILIRSYEMKGERFQIE